MYPTFYFELYFILLIIVTLFSGGTRWRSCLRHCAASRKVAGSIPDDVIGIFHWQNPCGHTLALRSTASNGNEYQEYFEGVKTCGA